MRFLVSFQISLLRNLFEVTSEWFVSLTAAFLLPVCDVEDILADGNMIARLLIVEKTAFTEFNILNVIPIYKPYKLFGCVITKQGYFSSFV